MGQIELTMILRMRSSLQTVRIDRVLLVYARQSSRSSGNLYTYRMLTVKNKSGTSGQPGGKLSYTYTVKGWLVLLG